MKYERLTERIHGAVVVKNELGHDISFFGTTINNALNRLAEYEGDEESGKIVRLPCKVGDTIWVVDESWGHREDGTWGSTSEMHEGKVYSFTYYGNCLYVEDDFTSNCYLWGEDAFLTREEAEKRLKELQE